MISDILSEYRDSGVVYVEISKINDRYYPELILNRGEDHESSIGETGGHCSFDESAMYIIRSITPMGTVRLVLPDGKEFGGTQEMIDFVENGNPVTLEIKVATS